MWIKKNINEFIPNEKKVLLSKLEIVCQFINSFRNYYYAKSMVVTILIWFIFFQFSLYCEILKF